MYTNVYVCEFLLVADARESFVGTQAIWQFDVSRLARQRRLSLRMDHWSWKYNFFSGFLLINAFSLGSFVNSINVKITWNWISNKPGQRSKMSKFLFYLYQKCMLFAEYRDSRLECSCLIVWLYKNKNITNQSYK